jgi:hypothetical protein
MDIGTIVAGLQALGNLLGANEPPAMTPTQAEGEMPKRKQQPNAVIFLPIPTPPQPLVMGVPPVFWSEQPKVSQMGQPAIRYPMLGDLYSLYFNTRW